MAVGVAEAVADSVEVVADEDEALLDEFLLLSPKLSPFPLPVGAGVGVVDSVEEESLAPSFPMLVGDEEAAAEVVLDDFPASSPLLPPVRSPPPLLSPLLSEGVEEGDASVDGLLGVVACFSLLEGDGDLPSFEVVPSLLPFGVAEGLLSLDFLSVPSPLSSLTSTRSRLVVEKIKESEDPAPGIKGMRCAPRATTKYRNCDLASPQTPKIRII